MISGNCNINNLQPQHMNANVNGKNELRTRRLGPLDGEKLDLDSKYSV